MFVKGKENNENLQRDDPQCRMVNTRAIRTRACFVTPFQKEDLYELINLKVDQSKLYKTSHAKLGKLDRTFINLA
jgi:hypothetical protein